MYKYLKFLFIFNNCVSAVLIFNTYFNTLSARQRCILLANDVIVAVLFVKYELEEESEIKELQYIIDTFTAKFLFKKGLYHITGNIDNVHSGTVRHRRIMHR